MLRLSNLVKAGSRAGGLVILRASQAVFGILIVVLMSRGMAEEALSSALLLTSITLNSGRVGVLGFDVPLVKLLGREAAGSKNTRRDYADLSGRFLTAWLGLLACSAIAAYLVPQQAIEASLGIPVLWETAWIFMASLQVFQSSVLLGLNRKSSSILSLGAASNAVTLVHVFFQVAGTGTISTGGLAKAYFCGLAVSIILSQVQIHRTMGWAAPRFGSRRGQEISFADLAASSAMNAIAMVSTQFPFWVIAFLGTDAQTVAFGLSFRLIMPLVVVLLAARTLVSPIVSKAWHERSLEETEVRLRNIATMSFGTILTISFVLILLRDWIFTGVFDQSSAGTFWPVALLLAGQACLAFFGQGMLILRLTDQANIALRVTIAAALFQIILAPALFWWFGVAGAAAAVALFGLAAALAPNLLVRRHHGIRIQARIPSPAPLG